MLTCSGVGSAVASSSGGSGGGGGLVSFDWPVILGLVVAFTLLALVSAVGTLILARRLPPAAVPIPVWPEGS